MQRSATVRYGAKMIDARVLAESPTLATLPATVATTTWTV